MEHVTRVWKFVYETTGINYKRRKRKKPKYFMISIMHKNKNNVYLAFDDTIEF